jgi:hypothetical protein
MPSLLVKLIAFGVCQDLIGGEALASNQSLYLILVITRLHLNAFRGVRAISKFDWPFTPTLNSFQKLFNAYRFGPPVGVTRPSTWSRVDHLVSRLLHRLWRPIQTRFRFGSGPEVLNLAGNVTRRFIMQKARRHIHRCSDRL